MLSVYLSWAVALIDAAIAVWLVVSGQWQFVLLVVGGGLLAWLVLPMLLSAGEVLGGILFKWVFGKVHGAKLSEWVLKAEFWFELLVLLKYLPPCLVISGLSWLLAVLSRDLIQGDLWLKGVFLSSTFGAVFYKRQAGLIGKLFGRASAVTAFFWLFGYRSDNPFIDKAPLQDMLYLVFGVAAFAAWGCGWAMIRHIRASAREHDLSLLDLTLEWAGIEPVQTKAVNTVHPQNDAQESLRQAATAGDATATYNLGLMYANGQGVRKDDAEAARWFRTAANQGHADAKYVLASMQAREATPVPGREAASQSNVQALRQAATAGDAGAQFQLGLMYANGQGAMGQGVRKDYAEAARWFRKAANQGHADAKYALASMQAREAGSVAGRETPRQGKFCAACGTRVGEEGRFCSNCGVQVRL